MLYDFIVFQMDLAQKFQDASTCKMILVEQVPPNQECTIVRARRLATDYGGSVAFF
jgi:hypothetical protein